MHRMSPPPLTGDFTFDRWMNLLWKDSIAANVTQNIIDTPTTIDADTSYVVVGSLVVDSDLFIDGNIGIL